MVSIWYHVACSVEVVFWNRGAKKEDEVDDHGGMDCQLSHLPETENEGGTIREIRIIIIIIIKRKEEGERAEGNELYRRRRGDE